MLVGVDWVGLEWVAWKWLVKVGLKLVGWLRWDVDGVKVGG